MVRADGLSTRRSTRFSWQRAKEVPKALLAQLKPGGRLVMPLGPAEDQHLSAVSKSADNAVEIRAIMPVRFSELET